MPPATLSPAAEKAIVRKVFWRIIPFCFLLFVISYIDRSNISYAALQMNKELGLSAEAFGFAAGVFFVGYFLFEVPSNLAMARFGARTWLARILITWGIVATLSAFVQNATQLYVLRFLLGVTEAGFFPGVVMYLTGWFRAKEYATTVAYFTAAIPASFLLGAPISTFIMDHLSGHGLSGWRWMLLLEGAPAILGGIAAYFLLIDRPAQAPWLSAEERAWLEGEIARDQGAVKGVRHLNTWKTLTDGKVLYLSLVFFLYQCGSFGINYWLPQILKSLSKSYSISDVGLITMVPYALATVAMVGWSIHSDWKRERQWHSALPLLVGGVALGAVSLVTNPAIAITLFSIAIMALYAFRSPFWALPSLFLTRSTAAISIAVINSVGNIGGFVGPFIFGALKDRTGNAAAGMMFLSGMVVIAAFMTWIIRLHPGREPPAEAALQPADAAS